MDEISLTGMKVECIVGMYPTERKIPQPLRIDLRLYLDTQTAGHDGHIADTVDYAEIGGEIRFLLEASRFFLVETACEAIARYLLAPPAPGLPRARVRAVRVEMTKIGKNIFGAVPGVAIERRFEQMSYEREERDFGLVDVLFAARECGIYRLRIRPGGTIPTHLHRVTDESEFVLTEGLLLQGAPVPRGRGHVWPKEFPHRYDNPTDKEQTILCVDCPSFLPDDEILTDRPLGNLAEVAAFDYYGPETYVGEG